jgi:hypothetical protein
MRILISILNCVALVPHLRKQLFDIHPYPWTTYNTDKKKVEVSHSRTSVLEFLKNSNGSYRTPPPSLKINKKRGWCGVRSKVTRFN